MKRKRVFLSLFIVAGLGWPASEGVAQLRGKRTSAFMRQKLSYSTAVLEGVTLGKFDLVIGNATALRNMSMTNAFLVLGNPAYGNAITNFQTAVDGLVAAAKEKDQVKTTEGYNEMIRSCVQCHVQFRREQALAHEK